MILIRATIEHPGLIESWVFDLDDRDERIDFARRADAALRRGATVTTRPETPDTKGTGG